MGVSKQSDDMTERIASGTVGRQDSLFLTTPMALLRSSASACCSDCAILQTLSVLGLTVSWLAVDLNHLLVRRWLIASGCGPMAN